MELPITKPCKVSYADELEFSEILEQMAEKEYDGFIRITHGSEEGYILFKDGDQVAASYDRYLKNDALEKIVDAMKKTDTLVEVFDLKPSQVDYLIDLNRAYKLEPIVEPEPPSRNEHVEEYSGYEKDYFNPKEASYRKSAEELRAEEELEYEKRMAAERGVESSAESEIVPEVTEMVEELVEEEPDKIEPKTVEKLVEEEPDKTEPETVEEAVEELVEEETVLEPEKVKPLEEEKPISEPELKSEVEIDIAEKEMDTTSKLESEVESSKSESALDDIIALDEESISGEGEVEEEESIPIDRSELMKKYGLRDIEEEEVDKMLETYKGGTVSSSDLERIELTIMNRVKQSVMGIPKINGVEVIVFLENARELGGKIKIITEYEGKGLFSRIMGDSKAIENLKYQISEIAEMEIRKSFREYPQIVENFDISIEIH